MALCLKRVFIGLTLFAKNSEEQMSLNLMPENNMCILGLPGIPRKLLSVIFFPFVWIFA